MRYNLRYSESVGEVKIQPHSQATEASQFSATVVTEKTSQTLSLKSSPGLIQVREPDGSLRSLPFTADCCDPQSVIFFHKGRVREAQAVGGIADSGEGMQSEGLVKAPMSGQVVKVPVEIGSELQAGDIVLILEAMKMENEVTAPFAGSLTELSVSVGDTVTPGQTLFTIEAFE